jgi:hypothetical protein
LFFISEASLLDLVDTLLDSTALFDNSLILAFISSTEAEISCEEALFSSTEDAISFVELSIS